MKHKISGIFQQVLGREPSNIEYDAFDEEFKAGRLDSLGLMTFLQGTQEYGRRNAPQMLADYSRGLQGQNLDFLRQANQIGFDQASADFRRMGRPYSSGLESKFAQVSGQQAGELARANFGVTSNMLANYFAGQAGAQQRLAERSYNRRYEIQDFYNQRDLMQQQWAREDSIANMNMRQAKENNWFGLAGGLLQGAGSLGGGYMYGRAMRGMG